MEQPDQRGEKWHIGKEIPIAVILGFFMQTVVAIWWAATLTAKIDELSYQVAALTMDKYTQGDAKRDQALIFQRMSSTENRVDKLEYLNYGGNRKWQR